LLRAGVVVAMVTGALIGIPGPAHAEGLTVKIASLSPTTLRSGEEAEIRFSIKNEEGLPVGSQTITFKVSVPGELKCVSGNCDGTVDLKPGDESQTFSARLRAEAQLGVGQTKDVTVTVTADGGGKDGSASRTIKLKGPDQAPAVTKVSGEVYDVATGEKISGALVMMQDSADRKWQGSTNSSGTFTFTSTPDKPIAPGQLLIGASKSGYRMDEPVREQGRAGASVTNVRIPLKAVAPTESPTPEPTEQLPTETPSDESSDDVAAEPLAPEEEDSGGGMLSWLLIGMGGLLVALGIGAIVLLLMRRGEDDEEEEGEEGAEAPGPHGPRSPIPRPAAAGVYRSGPDPTMVARTAPLGDPTMITRPGLADAPTALHQPVDEFPDPYNPPRPPYGPATYPSSPPPAYGAPQPTYGGGYGSPASPPADPYGHGPEYGGPAGPGGYGANDPRSGGYEGYGSAGGYDGGYGQTDPGYGSGRYGAGPGGYDQGPGGYDQETAGYGGRHGGYDSPGYGTDSGGYGGPDQDGGYGGYDQRSGYDQGSGRYDQGPGGYDQETAGYGGRHGGYDSPGYGTDSGGYGGYDQGRYPSEPRKSDGYDGYYDDGSRRGGPPSGGRGQRRSLDWLDD
jgi:hypothetical protein